MRFNTDRKYQIILSDPPWPYVNGGRGAAQNHYKQLTVAELCQLPIPEITAPTAALFLWATWPTLPDALKVMRAWDFEYKNCAFCWVKTNTKTPSDFVGLGHWTRGNTEPCLLGVRGSPHRLSAAVRQLIVEETAEALVAPIGRHSAKPAEARKRIVQLMGDAPRIELFGRERAEGWDAYGDEVKSDIVLI